MADQRTIECVDGRMQLVPHGVGVDRVAQASAELKRLEGLAEDARITYVASQKKLITPEMKQDGPKFVEWLAVVLDTAYEINVDAWEDADGEEDGVPVELVLMGPGGCVLHEAVVYVLEDVCEVDTLDNYEYDDFRVHVRIGVKFH
jgi:hypothetical protein